MNMSGYYLYNIEKEILRWEEIKKLDRSQQFFLTIQGGVDFVQTYLIGQMHAYVLRTKFYAT